MRGGAEAEVDMGPVVDKGLLADVHPMSTTRHNMFGWRYDAGVCAAKGCGAARAAPPAWPCWREHKEYIIAPGARASAQNVCI